jgi:predicted glycosyltransferase
MDYLIEVLVAGDKIPTRKISRRYSDEREAMHIFRKARRYYDRYSKYLDSDLENLSKKYSSYGFVERDLGYSGWNGAYICGAPKIYKVTYEDISTQI